MMNLFATTVYAAEQAPKTFAELVSRIVGYVDTITGMLIGAAAIIFFWGVVEFIASGGDKENIDSGKNKMRSGIIGLFAIVAVWGLVELVISIFGFGV